MAYNPKFIKDVEIPLPTLTPATLQQCFNGGTPLDHTNFSTVFNQARGLAVYSAHNIDGKTLLKKGPKRTGFTLDPLVKPNALQVDNHRGYKGFPTQEDNPWDAGHLARRRAVHWPNKATAIKANKESSYWTNIVPQHHRLNQGPWSNVEDFILKLADENDKRASVFTGPVFTDSDPQIVNDVGELPIRIPAGFWKVVAIKHQSHLCAAAFLLWQCDIQSGQPIKFDPVLEQVRLNTVEYLAGLFFDKKLRNADPLRFKGRNASCVIANAGDIAL